MNSVEKIKLLMKYDTKLSLNENLDKIHISEAPVEWAKELADAGKSLEPELKSLAGLITTTDGIKLLTTDDIIKALSEDKLAPINIGRVRSALLRGVNTSPELKSAIINDISSNPNVLRKWGQSDEQTIKNGFKNLGYPDDVANEMTNSILTKSGKSVQGAEAGMEAGKTAQDIEGGLNDVKPTKTMSDKMKEAIDAISPYLNSKWANRFKKLGWIGTVGFTSVVLYGGYAFFKSILGGYTDPESPAAINFLSCVLDLVNYNGVQITYTSKGEPVAIITKTGDSEYDKIGGIKLYTNFVAITSDRSRKGKWACVNENIHEQNQNNNGLIVDNKVKITWDNANMTNSSGTSPIHYIFKPDFPFLQGNKNPKIQEIQACLGLDPTRYQTGNYGPITLAALQKITPPLDLVNGITEDIYNNIKQYHCNSTTPVTGGGNTNQNVTPVVPAQVQQDQTIGTYNPEPTNEQNIAQGRNIFNSFKTQGLLRQSGNNSRIKYKGNSIDPNDLAMVNLYLSTLGYTEEKDMANKRYGEKYVWIKQ